MGSNHFILGYCWSLFSHFLFFKGKRVYEIILWPESLTGVSYVISSWRCLGNKSDKIATSRPSSPSVTCVWSVCSPSGLNRGNQPLGVRSFPVQDGQRLPGRNEHDSCTCHRYWMTRTCVGGSGRVTTRAPRGSSPSSAPCPCGWTRAGTRFSSTCQTSRGGRTAPTTSRP